MKTNICFFSGSRSEYYLIKNLYLKFKKSNNYKTNIIISGSHLSKKFGLTYKELKKNKIEDIIQLFIGNNFDTDNDIINGIILLIKNINKSLKKINPDIIILVGDRYETFCVSLVALIRGIKIAHIHGGEVTVGSFDENLRHMLTKNSHLHFVANNIFKKRVIQLGENPKKVFNVGGLGVDNIKKINFFKKNEIMKILNISKDYIIATYHPPTLINKKIYQIEFLNILKILNKLENIDIIFTYPGPDKGNQFIINKLNEFRKKNKNFKIYKSLGDKKYLSLLRYSKFIIGNSSSGIAEAPSFNIPSINIGERQKGRLFAFSVIQSNGTKSAIVNAIKKATSLNFLDRIKKKNKNPYGKGGAVNKIFSIISKLNLKSNNLLKKNFYDINFKW